MQGYRCVPHLTTFPLAYRKTVSIEEKRTANYTPLSVFVPEILKSLRSLSV
jgi:hypothetical protein